MDETMQLDKQTREAIASCVMKATREAAEMYDEQWLTGAQLSEQIGFFKKEWLKRYGDALGRVGCRKEVKVKDRNGVVHRTGWCYPKKKILRMIADGEMDLLEMPEEDDINSFIETKQLIRKCLAAARV